jgi:hypothetical protein
MDAAFLAIAMRGLTATLFLVLGVLLAPRTTKNQEPTRAREVPGPSFDNIRRAGGASATGACWQPKSLARVRS